MNRITIIMILIATFAKGFAQNSNDSVLDSKTISLNEITVEAQNQSINESLSTFIPSRSHKNAAQDAWSLLELTAIPQIDVNTVESSVTTPWGEGVSIFIDYNPATQDQLKGLKPTDVKKIEYHLFPKDPRFMNARYAINFIMQKYEIGGYTKVNASKSFGVNQTEGYIYSKLSYKDMIYDAYFGDRYLTTSHNAVSSTEYFNLPSLGSNSSFSRTDRTYGSKFRHNDLDASLRAVYQKQNLRISNQFSFSNPRTPADNQSNHVEYSNNLFNITEASTARNTTDYNFNYNGSYYAGLSSKISLSGFAKLIYGDNRLSSSYTANGISPIINDAREKSWYGVVCPSVYYTINNHHTLSAYVRGQWRYNNIKYDGSNPSEQRYNVDDYLVGLHYDLTFDIIRAGLEVGGTWERDKINSVRQTSFTPQFTLYANISPMPKTQISIAYNYAQEVPAIGEKSPNMLQQDEVIWYTGTPTLKNAIGQNGNAYYTWYISNKWMVSAGGSFYYLARRRVSEYTPDGPDGLMLRTYTNSGHYQTGHVEISARAKFFGSKLTVKVTPQMFFRKTTGIYPCSINEFVFKAQLSYNWKNFYVSANYRTRSHYPEEQSGYIVYRPQEYNIQLGWGNGNWNLNLGTYNFLNSNWKGVRKNLDGEYYSNETQMFGYNYHMRYAVSATYTFGYGKKVDRYNEVGGAERSGSAILR